MFETRLDHYSRSKKIILVAFFVCFFLLAARLLYLATKPAEMNPAEEIKPNYEKLMQSALRDYEDAQSAMIYKDYKKTGNLLKSAKNDARVVVDSEDLSEEAINLLGDIEQKEKELEELEKEAAEAEKEKET